MQKELYQIERSEVSLNISEGAVTEVRRKHIVRSGCRVYDGGKLGISGVFGEPDEATWQAAQRALTAGLSHPEPLGALVRSRETGVMPEERELLEQSEALLAHLREECPGFVFSNKIVALFSGALTLQVDRRPESWLPFFDAEGSVLEGDTLPLIENGVLVRGAADRAQAARYGCMATAAAGGAYDAAPCRSASEGCLRIAQTHSYAELLGDRSFILIDVASGGDMTPAGDFATPVQTAYLCRDGLPVGRLPEFSFRGSVFDLLGGGFLGRTDGGPLGGDGWTLLEGTIDA